jgi:hypothetical protein
VDNSSWEAVRYQILKRQEADGALHMNEARSCIPTYGSVHLFAHDSQSINVGSGLKIQDHLQGVYHYKIHAGIIRFAA